MEEIWPLALDHSVVKLDEKKGEDRRTRWQKIALEAAQQCGRSAACKGATKAI